MRPDFSVLLLTTLIGAGQGLFLALITAQLYALFGFLPPQDGRLSLTLNGRPIDPKAVEGFMFESVGGRVTYEVVRNVRVFGGYTRDRDNVGDPARQRYQAGVWMSNVAKTGLDINITEWRVQQAGLTTYNSLYVSVGKNILPRVYVNGEYNQSVSRLRLLTGNAFTLISNPQTHRYALSSTIRVTRPVSVLLNVERMVDAYSSEYRVMAGLTYRFDTWKR